MSITKLRSAALAATVLSATAISPMTTYAEVSGNLGVASNYVWRGVTQSADEAAVSGGLDYAHGSGFYLGTWVSNLADGAYEWDLYGGFAGEIDGFGYDVGLINYAYPTLTDADFLEVAASVSFQNFSAGVNYTASSDDDSTPIFSDGDLYVYVGAEFEVSPGLTLGLLAGNYSFDVDDRFDYSHFQVSLSKDDFTFAVEKNNADESDAMGSIWFPGIDDTRIVVSWSKSFDLIK